MAALALPPPDPPDDGMALLSVDLFLVSLGIQFDDPLPDLDDDDLLELNSADVEAYDPRVHFPPSLNPVPATPSSRPIVHAPTADSHSLAVSEPNAALLLSSSTKLELAPVAVVSPHRDLDHSSHCRTFSASSFAADSHSLAVSEPNAALLLSSSTKLELAPVAVVSPHRDLDHSSHCRPFSASSSAAVSYSRPALF